PILAHPLDTDSDITLQEWLAEMVNTDKGIKLDFKSVGNKGFPRKLLLHLLHFPAGIFPVRSTRCRVGGGQGARLSCVCAGPCGAVPGSEPCLSPGYTWRMVQEMSQLCQPLSQPVTFPVRAALLPASVPQLRWLLHQAPRYSLTVWTGKEDVYSVEDLLVIRENFDKSRVYYDIFEPQNSEFKKAIGI
ncbi:F151B protein, partial [Erpornis zantholeuca]|nr:F151B protein [Erpornis zantholeuca]